MLLLTYYNIIIVIMNTAHVLHEYKSKYKNKIVKINLKMSLNFFMFSGNRKAGFNI